MDAIFAAGKFKGRWFSDVAASETGFCSWAKKQKTPPGAAKEASPCMPCMAGYLRSFLAFLKSQRRGQQSLETHVVRSRKVQEQVQAVQAVQAEEQPAGSVRFDFCVALEVRPGGFALGTAGGGPGGVRGRTRGAGCRGMACYTSF